MLQLSEVVVEYIPQIRVTELQGAQPGEMLLCPMIALPEMIAISAEEFEKLVLYATQIDAGGVSAAGQFSGRLLLGIGGVDLGEQAGFEERHQFEGVAAVRLDALAGFDGGERRRDDAAFAGVVDLDALLEYETAGAGLVAEPDVAGGLLAKSFDQPGDFGGRIADFQLHNFLLAGEMHCNGVFFFVGVHANISYTRVHDRLLSLYAALLPKGSNPRFQAATCRLCRVHLFIRSRRPLQSGAGRSICSTLP